MLRWSLCLLALLPSCAGALAGEGGTLKSTLAGSWFSGDAKELKVQADAWMKAAGRKDFKSPVIALVQPHAGYAYSGKVAAFGVAQIAGQDVSRVVVMGPSHRVFMKDKVCVPESSAMSTPLGETPIDTAFVERLRKLPFVKSSDQIHLGEHSVQIQLPLLQCALKDFKIVPIVVGQLDNAALKEFADALKDLLDDGTVLIASSDFTHYGDSFGYTPFRTDLKANIEKLDMGAYEAIRTLDASAFIDYVEKTQDTICGEYPIAVLLKTLPKDAEPSLLRYDTSGAQTGDFSHSVSYLSIAFAGAWAGHGDGKKEELSKPDQKAALSDSDKKALLQMARKILSHYMMTRQTLSAERSGVGISAAMKSVMGAFVTLKEGGELRGCIGEIVPRRPLCDAVAERVLDSAFHDPRFNPLRPEELDKVEIEISALTPSKPVDSYKDIVIGRHGMTVSKNGRSAVFLPQVAPEQGWTLEETLTHLSMKAGLPPDAWRSGAKFTVFEAIVFNEAQFKGKE